MIERRALQIVVAVACLLPFVVGGMGVVRGPAAFGHADPRALPVDLDSQFRYVSGIFLGLGFGFASCIPAIERRGGRFAVLAMLVVVGGLARGGSWLAVGAPSFGHRLGLVMELAVVPCLVLWQRRVARRMNRTL